MSCKLTPEGYVKANPRPRFEEFVRRTSVLVSATDVLVNSVVDAACSNGLAPLEGLAPKYFDFNLHLEERGGVYHRHVKMSSPVEASDNANSNAMYEPESVL